MHKYLNFISFSNGDMIFDTSSNIPYNKRVFYGLKNNGRCLFTKNKAETLEETPLYSMDMSMYYDNEVQNERGNSIVNINGEEYYITIGKYIEFFGIKNNKYHYKVTNQFFGDDNSNCKANLISLGNNNYIYSINSNSIITKFTLTIASDIFISSISKKNLDKILNINNILSCFKNEANFIIIIYCLYDYAFESNKDDFIYIIDAFNQNLEKLNTLTYTMPSNIKNSYATGISLKAGGGAFIYYNSASNSTLYYPNIIFKKYNSLTKNFDDLYEGIDSIILDKYILNKDKFCNDLIQISDNKLGFFSMSNDLKTLFIIIMNSFQSYGINKIKIRYYSMKISDLINNKFFENIKTHIFNDFIIIGANYCSDTYCNERTDSNYISSLMFIGYPNSTDYELNIINYLIQNKNKTIDNLIFDLSENLTIENNIFGYVYDGIKIRSSTGNGYIYLISSLTNKSIDSLVNDELNITEEIKVKFRYNIYDKSSYTLVYSYIVTEPDYEIYDSYPTSISTSYGNDDPDIFNFEKKRYLGKNIYFNIILTDYLITQCKNSRCLLCFSINYTCVSYKSDDNEIEANTNPEVIVPPKKELCLDILYSFIIIFPPCFILFFIFPSYQYLRITFYICQFIIFCVLSFDNRYKNHFLWENINYEQIHVTPYPVIKELDVFYIDDWEADITYQSEYQNFSIIETEEYSKECLNNYFIKENDICPITDIIRISYDNYNNYYNKYNTNYIDYELIEIDGYYIYYKKFNRYGNLYKNCTKEKYYKSYSYNNDYMITFYSDYNYSNIDLIKNYEEMKIINPFHKLKVFSPFSDSLWIPLFIFSFIYFLIESKNDEKWSYFRIIDYIIQLILSILFIVRYIFFVDLKKFFRNNGHMFNEKNLNLIYDKDKYFFDYKPNLNINAECFPVAITMTIISLFLLSLIIKNKNRCIEKNFTDNKYSFFEDNIKGRIYFLLLPFSLMYVIFCIEEIVNDFNFIKIYDNIMTNWNSKPISSIEVSRTKDYEIGHIFSKDKKYIYYSWKNSFFSIQKNNSYSYIDMLTNTNGKKCGIDSFGNYLYFPSNLECPINHIFIDNQIIDNTNYTNIYIGNFNYLHYTNKNINGQIIIDLRVGHSSIPLEFDSKSNDLCEGILKKVRDVIKCEKYYKFNTVPFYKEIDTCGINEFDKSFELINNDTENNISLYALTYQGINSTSIKDINITKYFRNNINTYKILSICKIIGFLLNILFFVYFTVLIFVDNTIKIYTFVISVIILVIEVIFLIITSVSFNINKKYIQNFTNKINKDFEKHKIGNLWNLMVIIFITFYIAIYSIFISYYFLFSEQSLFKINIKEVFKKAKESICNCLERICNKDEKKDDKNTSVNDISQQENLCTLCMTNQSKMIFAPCGHKCCCEECYNKYNNNNQLRNCPLCRQPVVSAISKVF